MSAARLPQETPGRANLRDPNRRSPVPPERARVQVSFSVHAAFHQLGVINIEAELRVLRYIRIDLILTRIDLSAGSVTAKGLEQPRKSGDGQTVAI